MFKDTITVFNFHEHTRLWYPSIIEYADVKSVLSKTSTQNAGTTNNDATAFLIHCSADKIIKCKHTQKQYLKPKEYSESGNPDKYITFNPEQDFIVVGEWDNTDAISDSDFSNGLYNAVNNKFDDVCLICSVAYFGLLPHFEIEGK